MSRPWSVLRAVVDALLDLALPQVCAGCALAGHWLCPRCAGALLGAGHEVRPAPAPAGLPPVFAVAAYDSVVRALVVAHKERARLELAVPLGRALAEAVRAAASSERAAAARERVAPGRVLLVPVPSRPATVRARGHDPLQRMARVAGTAAGGLTVARVLVQRRRVVDQSGLSADLRHANLAGALEVRARRRAEVCGRSVILLDDVITTGSTLAEAARAVRSAGGSVVAAAVVAATPRRAAGRGG